MTLFFCPIKWDLTKDISYTVNYRDVLFEIIFCEVYLLYVSLSVPINS